LADRRGIDYAIYFASGNASRTRRRIKIHILPVSMSWRASEPKARRAAAFFENIGTAKAA